MTYCIICGNLLKVKSLHPDDISTYECTTCKTIKTQIEMNEIEPYEIVKIKELIKENITLKERLEKIEKVLEI